MNLTAHDLARLSRKAPGKWTGDLPIIERMALTNTAQEIAKEIGTSVNNLHKICHRNHIKLGRPEIYQKNYAPQSIEAAIMMLTAVGYTVEKI